MCANCSTATKTYSLTGGSEARYCSLTTCPSETFRFAINSCEPCTSMTYPHYKVDSKELCENNCIKNKRMYIDNKCILYKPRTYGVCNSDSPDPDNFPNYPAGIRTLYRDNDWKCRSCTADAAYKTPGSNKKVWWQCVKGHEWKTEVAHRTSGRRCPVCYGESKTSFPEQAIFYYLKKALNVINRYKLNNITEIDIYIPDLQIGIEYDGAYYHKGKDAEDREKRKNAILKDNNIMLIRIKEIETLLENTDTTIYTKIYQNDDDLLSTIKTLISYINKIRNLELNIDINIRRDRNDIYNQYINSEKEKSLLVVNPIVAAEWHPTKNGKLLPEHVTPSSNKKVWWICKEGHEWEAVINSRNKGIGCPYCAGKKAIVGYNDLQTANPRLALEWHPTKNGGLKPTDVTESSNRFVWWICEKGHEYKSMIYDRKNGCNCPICSGHKVLIGYNDLATVNPSLASEWHPTKNGDLTSKQITIGSSKKAWWICKKGHEWQAQVCSRKAGRGCPICYKKSRSKN